MGGKGDGWEGRWVGWVGREVGRKGGGMGAGWEMGRKGDGWEGGWVGREVGEMGLKDERGTWQRWGEREREEGKQTVLVCKDSGQSEVNWFESEGHLHSTEW